MMKARCARFPATAQRGMVAPPLSFDGQRARVQPLFGSRRVSQGGRKQLSAIEEGFRITGTLIRHVADPFLPALSKRIPGRARSRIGSIRSDPIAARFVSTDQPIAVVLASKA